MEIVYWNDKFDRFVTSLDRITSSQVINILDLLKDRRNLLDMPDSKSLGKGLLELRTNGKVKVRILYIFHNNKAVIVNYFVKKTWKIPLRDISYARKIQKEITKVA